MYHRCPNVVAKQYYCLKTLSLHDVFDFTYYFFNNSKLYAVYRGSMLVLHSKHNLSFRIPDFIFALSFIQKGMNAHMNASVHEWVHQCKHVYFLSFYL